MGKINTMEKGGDILILPTDFFDDLKYFEHTYKHKEGTMVYDVYTLHFKSWWKRKRVIEIQRIIKDHDKETGMFTHSATASAADLYNQLNGWAIQTHDEKLDSVKHKYKKHDDHDNVLVMKPKPKDIDDDK